VTPPPVKYAKSGDIFVAYQVTGEGSHDLVWAPGAGSHLTLAWENPYSARMIERLSSFSRLIRFDKRGSGLSDAVKDVATLEQRIDDIRAVMDAAGTERAHVLGISEGGPMACLFGRPIPIERDRSRSTARRPAGLRLPITRGPRTARRASDSSGSGRSRGRRRSSSTNSGGPGSARSAPIRRSSSGSCAGAARVCRRRCRWHSSE